MTERPMISATALAHVLAQYPALGEFKALTRNGLSINTAACLFETSEGTFFAKRYDTDRRDRESLEAEHRLIRRLLAAGYPTPRLHANRNGETLSWHESAPYALFDLARGEDRYGPVPVFAPFQRRGQARSAGARLAELHLALRGEGAAPRPFRGLTARFELLRFPTATEGFAALIQEAPALSALRGRPEWESLLSFVEARRQELEPSLDALPRGLIHGDYIKRNLFWEGDRVSEVLDFDLWNAGPWVFDLALSLLPCAFNWPEILANRSKPRFDDLASFLAGYQSVRPLEAAERSALAAVMETARFEFYLSVVSMAIANGDQAQQEQFWRLLVDTLGWFDRHPEWREGLACCWKEGVSP